VGEAVEDVVLDDLLGKPRRLTEWLGERATILYSWSATCPCVGECDRRIAPLFHALRAEHGEKAVRWIAVAGAAEDTPEVVLETMGLLRAPYRMLLDPRQRLTGRLGLRSAAHVAVLDGHGYLRYRGTIDDDLKAPTRDFLAGAVKAVLEGRRPDPEEFDVEGYGCPFGEPPPEPCEEP
jgi:hypothetical protein